MIRFVRDIVRVLNLACEQHTALFSRELDEPLRPGERAGLWLHVRVCAGCRRFRRQMRAMREMARSLASGLEGGEAMPAGVRRRIGESLDVSRGDGGGEGRAKAGGESAADL
ncbi:MAG: hypothetical protein R3B68_15075 [Phycisphaerales bacterium]